MHSLNSSTITSHESTLSSPPIIFYFFSIFLHFLLTLLQLIQPHFSFILILRVTLILLSLGFVFILYICGWCLSNVDPFDIQFVVVSKLFKVLLFSRAFCRSAGYLRLHSDTQVSADDYFRSFRIWKTYIFSIHKSYLLVDLCLFLHGPGSWLTKTSVVVTRSYVVVSWYHRCVFCSVFLIHSTLVVTVFLPRT